MEEKEILKYEKIAKTIICIICAFILIFGLVSCTDNMDLSYKRNAFVVRQISYRYNAEQGLCTYYLTNAIKDGVERIKLIDSVNKYQINDTLVFTKKISYE
jgi:hypothetical protein